MHTQTRHIADPIHGAIDLSPVEMEIIDTPSFQRLRRIRQLAMANRVYPGADHSRFVHSLGVFAIMSQVVARLRKIAPVVISAEDAPKLRLAALLHDVGHYPYSHVMEKVELPTPPTRPESEPIQPREAEHGVRVAPTPGEYPKHVEVGERVVCRRGDIKSALKARGFDPHEIASIFCGKHRESLYNQLATSALDVDRMDYMLRDAHYTGVPFGRIDLHYITRNIEIDDEGKLCINPKAVPSVEHFLLSRWYNYGVIVFQKTVMGMEALTRALLRRMVEDVQWKEVPRTREEVWKLVDDRERFLQFDDVFVEARIRELASAARSPDPASLMARAIVDRVKPRCVFEAYGGADDRDGLSDRSRRLIDFYELKKVQWADKYGIPQEYWFLADSRPRILEEVKLLGTLTDEEQDRGEAEGERAQKRAKVIRVKRPDGSSEPLAAR
jgi:HD superfamily phosphohydrolase